MQESLAAGQVGTRATLDDPAAFLARCLASRALQSRMLPCDLRSGRLTHPSVITRERRRLNAAAALFLAGGILLCGGSLLATGLAREQARVAENAFQARAQDVAGIDLGAARREYALSIVEAQLAERADALRPFADVFSPSLTEVLLSVLSIGKSESLQLQLLSVNRGEIMIQGVAGEWRGCDGLVDSLREAGYPVVLDRRDALEGERIPFTIRQ